MIIDILPVGLPIDYIAFDNGFTAGWFSKFAGRCGLRWVGVLSPKTVVHYHGRRYQVHELAEKRHLRWRERLRLRAQAIMVYAPRYGTLRLVVTRNHHGSYEYIEQQKASGLEPWTSGRGWKPSGQVSDPTRSP